MQTANEPLLQGDTTPRHAARRVEGELNPTPRAPPPLCTLCARQSAQQLHTALWGETQHRTEPAQACAAGAGPPAREEVG